MAGVAVGSIFTNLVQASSSERIPFRHLFQKICRVVVMTQLGLGIYIFTTQHVGSPIVCDNSETGLHILFLNNYCWSHAFIMETDGTSSWAAMAYHWICWFYFAQAVLYQLCYEIPERLGSRCKPLCTYVNEYTLNKKNKRRTVQILVFELFQAKGSNRRLKPTWSAYLEIMSSQLVFMGLLLFQFCVSVSLLSWKIKQLIIGGRGSPSKDHGSNSTSQEITNRAFPQVVSCSYKKITTTCSIGFNHSIVMTLEAIIVFSAIVFFIMLTSFLTDFSRARRAKFAHDELCGRKGLVSDSQESCKQKVKGDDEEEGSQVQIPPPGTPPGSRQIQIEDIPPHPPGPPEGPQAQPCPKTALRLDESCKIDLHEFYLVQVLRNHGGPRVLQKLKKVRLTKSVKSAKQKQQEVAKKGSRKKGKPPGPGGDDGGTGESLQKGGKKPGDEFLVEFEPKAPTTIELQPLKAQFTTSPEPRSSLRRRERVPPGEETAYTGSIEAQELEQEVDGSSSPTKFDPERPLLKHPMV